MHFLCWWCRCHSFRKEFVDFVDHEVRITFGRPQRVMPLQGTEPEAIGILRSIEHIVTWPKVMYQGSIHPHEEYQITMGIPDRESDLLIGSWNILDIELV